MTRLLRVLVANRGEIARRVFRSAAARGMQTVAVFSDADADAPFAREADFSVRLPGRAPADTYLRADLLVAAALRAGADCVHPGYGFLSENAAFARQVQAAGLVWIGPPPEAIEAMASKLTAKALMSGAGVPTAPSADVTGLEGGVLVDAADAVGYPLLVKAALGGGGRGMRAVASAADVAEAVQGARSEAASAFGDGTVFLERLVTPARHVEVQIFGDTHGTVTALHERECSIQRRHQKVVEEAPSTAVDPALRELLCSAAVTAGAAIGYVGAGTVEFLLAPDGRFYFLEVNTRLQVEHPVTEAITGLDLVDLQFLVAEGGKLPAEACTPALNGAAIEVRLYAEDPEQDWLPQAGRLDSFTVPHDRQFRCCERTFRGSAAGVRLDSGVVAGSTIGVAYDPMLAKVIAWAPDREAASAVLAAALRTADISGLVTNRDLLVRVLESSEWRAGETTTDFFDRVGLSRLATPLVRVDEQPAYALAAAWGQAQLRRMVAPVLGSIPSGWRSNPSQPQQTAYTVGSSPEPVAVSYSFGRARCEAFVDGQRLNLDGPPEVDSLTTGSARISLSVEGVRRAYEVRVVSEPAPPAALPASRVHVRGPEGSLTLVEVPRFPEPAANVPPGSLTAPMPGSVVRILVGQGEEVEAGQPVLVLEAMKMEHPVFAPSAGTVSMLAVVPGAQVETGSLLAVVTGR